MKFNKILDYLWCNKILTFWLIFLNCISIYPVKLELTHHLNIIDNNTYWESTNQSLKYVKESLTLYFFSLRNRKLALEKEGISKSLANIYEETDCKNKNDTLLMVFLHYKMEWKKNKTINKDILDLQNIALDLIQNCKEPIVKENAKKIIYWLNVYEVYHND